MFGVEIMNCPNCGFQITNGAMFCGNCGQRLAQQQPAVTYQQQTPAYQRPARQLVCSRGAVKSILFIPTIWSVLRIGHVFLKFI